MRRLPAVIFLLLAGCGSGGTNPPTSITGVVTDIQGQAVAGAGVRTGGNRTTSLGNGSFTLENTGDRYQTVHAETTINGRKFNGQTVVDTVSSERNRSVNVVVSPETEQGTLAGTVIDNFGMAVPGAKVFVEGPIGSTLGITDNTGSYSVPRLVAGTTYRVTCSLAGFFNDSKSITIDRGTTRFLSFVLPDGVSQGPHPAVQNLSAQSWTVGTAVERSGSGVNTLPNWVRRAMQRRFGKTAPVLSRSIERKDGRATASSSLVEIDLFWTYEAYNDLFGYLIRRGAGTTLLRDEAVLRDPLANAFFDLDPSLQPGREYFYTVTRLDTVDFPANGAVGVTGSSVRVTPLAPQEITAPLQGAAADAAPLLQWRAVTGAKDYQIYVWDRFPDLQNGSDPDGVAPIWPSNPSQPGASLVDAPAVSQRYQGPALQPGRTYYWMVVAANADGSALAASPIRKFTVR
jgi:hypothetical protein